MTGYNTIENGASNNDQDDNERPHVYSDAVGSAPLITWFGLPTRIELAAEESEPSPLQGKSCEQKRRSNSGSFLIGGTAVIDEGDDTHSISAYTYRVRTLDHQSSDDHRLLLCQNPDGTYSHASPNEDGIDDVPESEDALLMMSHGENLKASISLDTVMNLEETLTKMDDGTLPPHVHPSIPTEMLNPEYTRTTPALKMWPLAVLVFYSEWPSTHLVRGDC
jgi:hypothetical protein